MVMSILIPLVMMLTAVSMPVHSFPPEGDSPMSGTNTGGLDLMEVTVYADQDRGPVRLYTGFLHGFEEADPVPLAKIHALNPSAWRICKWWQQDHVAQFTDNIQFGVSFSWRWYEYGNPAADISLWEQYVTAQVNYSLANNKHVEYWDVWNEPDHAYFWSWSYDDLLLTFKSTIDTVRALDPGAKFIGPSFAMFTARDNFGGKTVADFIVDLYNKHGILLDAVSWHMNDEWYPWNIQGHVDTLRTAIDSIGGGYDPELVINEYTQSLIVLRPVYLASFVWHMDKAEIDFSNLACWNIYEQCNPPSAYSTCWAGLNGLFTRDYSVEQHPYWFYLWHGEEKGNRRLAVSEPEVNTFALASRNDVKKEIVICVGRHSHTDPVQDVLVTVTGYPHHVDEVIVRTGTLEDENQLCDDDVWRPLEYPCPDGPRPRLIRRIPVIDGQFSIPIDDFRDEELHFIRISVPPTSK